MNPAMAVGLGLSTTDRQEHMLEEWVHKDQHSAMSAALSRLAAGQRSVALVVQMTDGAGGWRWITWSASFAEGNSCWIGQEIDHLQQELCALRESEARLRRFFEHSPDTLLVHDMEGRLLEVNESACRNLGYTREELLSLHISDIELTIKSGSHRGIWSRMTPGITVSVEGRHRRKDGTTFPIEARLGLFGAADQLFLHALCHDISARKRNQRSLEQLNLDLIAARDQALAASQAKSAFLAGMSHELRTPLNAITGYAELLEEELEHTDSQWLCADTQKIQRASSHLLHLINEILDLSKIEAGQFTMEWQSVRPDGLLRRIASSTRPLFEQTGNVLRCDIAPELQEFTSDPVRLEQVLGNILDNANKFTHQGEVTLRVFGCSLRSGEGEGLRFEVEDTGIGIAPRALAEIFEPFVQADATSTRRYEGTGLGLTISRRLCHLLGGELYAQSVLGQGSCFALELPLHPNDRTESKSASLLDSVGAFQAKSLEALLIASNESLHEQFARVFRREQILMRSALSGEKGLADMRAYQPNYVLLHMPSDSADDIDVWSVLDQARQDQATANIPVVLLSSRKLSERERDKLQPRVHQIFESSLVQVEEVVRSLRTFSF